MRSRHSVQAVALSLHSWQLCRRRAHGPALPVADGATAMTPAVISVGTGCCTVVVTVPTGLHLRRKFPFPTGMLPAGHTGRQRPA